jgi:hypothetical protein
MSNLPDFDLMLHSYPKDADPEAVKKLVGGDVNEKDITNTCTIRLSRALNYSAVPIPPNFGGLHVRRGADKKWYALRVREMKPWLRHVFGAPDLVQHKSAKTPIDRKAFAGRSGIIGFDIHFKDATGHLDLWDGVTFTHESVAGEDYFAMATEAVLWVAPGTVVTEAPV